MAPRARAQRVRIDTGPRGRQQGRKFARFAAEAEPLYAQRRKQLHAALREMRRVAYGEQRGQLEHEIRAAAQRHFGPRPFRHDRRLAALRERTAHRADDAVAPRLRPQKAQKARVSVMKGVKFADNAQQARLTVQCMFSGKRK